MNRTRKGAVSALRAQPDHDRMPVLLERGEFSAWLDGLAGPELLRPAPESALREWLVSKRMNKTGVGDDDPTLIDHAA